MSKRLLTLYTDILAAANATVDDEGFISLIAGKGKTTPYMVNKKRMILPTPEMLRRPSWDDLVAFHPLRENALKGESEVLEALRETFCIRLSYASVMLILGLLHVCASPAQHKLLSPDQQLLLRAVGEADQKTVDAWQEILLHLARSSLHEGFVHIYLRRRVELSGKVFDRGGVVTFPFWKEIEKAVAEDSTVLCGRKLRAKDIKAIKGVCNFIFPQIDTPHSYSRGSYSQVAPFTDALMQSVMAIGMRLNDIADQYADFLTDVEISRISDAWVEEFSNLDSFVNDIRMIPALPGNDGAEKQHQDIPAANMSALRTPTPPPAPAPAAPVVHTPPPPMYAPPAAPQAVPYTSAAEPSRAGGVSFSSLVGQAQNTPPPYIPPPPPYWQGNPQQGYPQGYPQPYTQPYAPAMPPQPGLPMTPWGGAPAPGYHQMPQAPQRASVGNPYAATIPAPVQQYPGQYGMSQAPQQQWGAPMMNTGPRGPVL